MTKLATACVALAALVFGLLAPSPAHAAFFKTFVSKANGNDANNCDIKTPCFTIGHALTQTFGLGEVHCADAGNFDELVTITFSVTIDCDASAIIGPFIINGAGVTVTIRNGSVVNGGTPAGIDFQTGAALILQNLYITDRVFG